MKKLFALLLAWVLLCALTLPALADVIYEQPDTDPFFEAHEDECVDNHGRWYIVNTDSGYTYRYRTPEAKETVASCTNGMWIAIHWLYTDRHGQVWGTCKNDNEPGWYRMEDLSVIYDTYSFLEEHASELVDYVPGTYSISVNARNVYMWDYPGKRSNRQFDVGDVADFVDKTYTDPGGTVWGYIADYGYSSYEKDVWVCLSDPDAEEVPGATEATQPPLKAEPVPCGQIPEYERGTNMLLVAGLLVGGVMAVTAGIIVLFFVLKKKKPAAE